MAYSNLQIFIVELIGTFILVFAGTGAIIINDIANHTSNLLGDYYLFLQY